MPHVIVKMVSGKSEQQKKALTDAITESIMDILGNEEGAVSLAIEEFAMQDWLENVFKPDIKTNMDKLYKNPAMMRKIYNPPITH